MMWPITHVFVTNAYASYIELLSFRNNEFGNYRPIILDFRVLKSKPHPKMLQTLEFNATNLLS